MDSKENPGDPQPISCLCSSWAEIWESLSQFPPQKATFDYDLAESTETFWIFRGLWTSDYDLESAIEREARSTSWDWDAQELRASHEFKARARSHLNEALIPSDDAAFNWLALMQHYGVPTRLLDFTYSPFVALYFAIRDGREIRERTRVRVWAIDASAVNSRFWSVTGTAEREAGKREGMVDLKLRAASCDPDDFVWQSDEIAAAAQRLQVRIKEALFAKGTYRGALNRSGCVCVASPPSFNPRLICQQGVFMINLASGLSFEESLRMMMNEQRTSWRKAFDIPIAAIPEIEDRLYQMNIHEQSLFPDSEGLAGLIRQKIRLHWR